jgi:hypothetical protein
MRKMRIRVATNINEGKVDIYLVLDITLSADIVEPTPFRYLPARKNTPVQQSDGDYQSLLYLVIWVYKWYITASGKFMEVLLNVVVGGQNVYITSRPFQ